MLDIAELPIGSKLVITNANPYRGDEQQFIQKAEDNVGNLALGIRDTRNRLQEQHPDRIKEIEAVYNLFYGIFLLPSNLELDHLPEADKTMAARIAHNFTHHIVHCDQPEVDDKFIVGVYRAASMMQEAASRLLSDQQDHAFATFWSGIKSEVAIVRVLSTTGYRVLLPEYSLNPDRERDETLQFDVRSGVDIIAEKDHRVFLIDAKGRARLSVPEVVKQNSPLSSITNPLLRTEIEKIKPKILIRATVMIPSRECGSLDKSSNHPNISEYKNELKRLGQLPDYQVKMITQMLEL